MFRKLLIITIPLCALIFLCSSQLSDNGKAGRTGSPGESNCTSCHSSFPLNSGGGSITLQSPGTPGFQYTPGQTYTMSVTVTKASVLLFGVGIEALTLTNDNAGTLNITDASSTQAKFATVNAVSRKNIVHTFNGGVGSGSKIFNFSWTAPAAGTGNVTFYFAGIAANGNTNENGDYVYTSSQVFTELNCLPPAAPASISGNTTICSGATTTYSVTPVTGATSYTWTLPSGWTGTSTTNSINVTGGSASGQIKVTANNVCGSSPQTALSVTITSITANTSTVNVSCNGGSNGSATVTPSGGAGGYSYAWSPSGGNAATANNLAAGTYTVTVTDAYGCTKTASVTITQPSAITIGVIPTNAACANGNGSATATPSGGTGPYTYLWTPTGGTAATATLPAGTYTVRVTDSHSCSSIQSVTITQPAQLTVTLNSVNSVCANGNGSATAITTGGTAPYTYQWTPSGGTAATATLPAGTYTVNVTDAHSCTTSQSVTITQPAPMAITTSTTDATCGLTNGTATASPAGGTAPYSYVWNSNPPQHTATADSLASGNYMVTVTDSRGCTNTASVIVHQPSTLTATSAVTAVNCYGGSDGQATVIPAGGTPAYTYLWNTIPPQTTATASNLAAGSYSATVTDSSGCSYTETITVTEPAQLMAITGTDTSICNGNTIALIGSATGGTTSYSYLWSPASGLSSVTDSNPSASPSATTVYSLTVTDAHNCTAGSDVVVTVLPAPVATIILSGDSLLSSSGDSYQWFFNGNIISGANNNVFVPLVNGNYSVIVSAINGCSDTSAIFTVSTVGIADMISTDQLLIYPNPASQYINVIIPHTLIKSQLIIYDILGNTVMRTMLSKAENHLEMKNIQKGYYTLVISDDS